MRRSTGLTRFIWRITALLQLVLPPVVMVADAQLEREAVSARAYSHVESERGKDCVPVHTPDCALCQHLTSSLARPSKASLPLPSAQPDLAPSERRAAAVSLADQRPSLPRAPPHLS
jgi:hypothetical protein